MSDDKTDVGDGHEHEERPVPGPAPAEVAPTDYRRNVWLLIIIIVVVLLAWALAVFWKVKSSKEIARIEQPASAPAPSARGAAPPLRPAPPKGPMAVPVAVRKVVGQDTELILASPALRLPTGEPYRQARYFDVTSRVDGFDPQSLIRIADRRSDQVQALVVASLKGQPFKPASQVTTMAPEERVVVVSLGGQSRAYPVSVLGTTVGVQDRLDGRPVFVCWNRPTQMARCFIAELDGEPVEWRDAGLLYRGNNVLYDRQSGSLWDSATGVAVAGPLAGKRAQVVPVELFTWETWSKANPDVSVLTVGVTLGGTPLEVPISPTGGADPYVQDPAIPFPLQHVDASSSSLPMKAFVLGVELNGVARAYPLAALADRGTTALTDTVGNTQITLHVTSKRTAYATADGRLIDAPVMLWFAWKELHPQTELYQAAQATSEGATGAAKAE